MLTLVPATLWGFADRGLVREGMAADLVVFDPETIAPEMPEVVRRPARRRRAGSCSAPAASRPPWSTARSCCATASTRARCPVSSCAARSRGGREPAPAMRLAGKVALISGGARGMGAAEAHLFTREGARVVIGDVLDDEGRAVEAAVRPRAASACSCTSTSPARTTGSRRVARRRSASASSTCSSTTPASAARGRLEDTHGRGVGPGDGGQRQGRVPRHQGGDPRHAARPAAARSSTSRRSSAWSGWTTAARSTSRPRARCGCSPS